MPSNPLPLPQGGSSPDPQFRTAPWFILREKTIKSNGAALILSVIWSSLQSSGSTGVSTPGLSTRLSKLTNKEIARRTGLRINPEAVRRHMASLEQVNLIKRHGKACNRTIEVITSPHPDEDFRSLAIPENIFTSDLSPTRKLL